jgi:hypothetical protein
LPEVSRRHQLRNSRCSEFESLPTSHLSHSSRSGYAFPSSASPNCLQLPAASCLVWHSGQQTHRELPHRVAREDFPPIPRPRLHRVSCPSRLRRDCAQAVVPRTRLPRASARNAADHCRSRSLYAASVRSAVNRLVRVFAFVGIAGLRSPARAVTAAFHRRQGGRYTIAKRSDPVSVYWQRPAEAFK